MKLRSLIGGLAGILASALVGAQGFIEFPLSPNATPNGIAKGPDGNIWFTETGNGKIGRITPAGVIAEFALPTFFGSNDAPWDITVGPDGNLWFTTGSRRVGQITTNGVVTEFQVPACGLLSCGPLGGITAGPDGNLWFTESGRANSIGQITTNGVIVEFPIALPPKCNSGDPLGECSSQLYNITAGPDGNLWFTELNASKIGRITTAGVITEFPLSSDTSAPDGITAGPDGNFWFTDQGTRRIGRITTAGLVTEFPIAPGFIPGAIAVGPDANPWFLESSLEGGGAVGRITSAGVITEFPIPSGFAATNLAAGSDGNLWFTINIQPTSSSIGRMSLMPGLCLNAGRFCVQVTWQAASGAGTGVPSPITSNTGAFWFFDPTNLELVIKVLDGRSVDGHFWVFYGSLTNVEFTLTVTDTQTGAVKTYFNPQGQLASVADTSAF